jgi:hypothetical protein
MTQTLLDERRDGSHTDDSSGDVSSYLSPSALLTGSSTTDVCNAIEERFNVTVLEYAITAAGDSSSCKGPLCGLNWKIWVAIVAVLLCICIGIPVYIQRRYTNYINKLLGLAMYDSDDEADADTAQARLYLGNDPGNWVRISTKKGRDIEDEGGDEEFYYYNLKTGLSQWERPLFTLGPPVPRELVAAQGYEDDPRTWVSLTITPGEEADNSKETDALNPMHSDVSKQRKNRTPQQYYYNTKTKRTTWALPRFSSNWDVDADGNAVRLAPLLDRSRSGFESVYGRVPGRFLDSKPRPSPPWDFSTAADPTLVHGGFTVDSKDERREAFSSAARQIREEMEWDAGSDVVCEIALETIVARAESELKRLRKETPLRSNKSRTPRVYSPTEISQVLTTMTNNGAVEMKSFGAPISDFDTLVNKVSSVSASFDTIGSISSTSPSPPTTVTSSSNEFRHYSVPGEGKKLNFYDDDRSHML